jgi:hypothetical protein
MMTSYSSSPRRLLLVTAIVAGLALAPPAAARVHPQTRPSRPVPGVRAVLLGDFAAALDFAFNLLHCVGSNAGASLDPLGNH